MSLELKVNQTVTFSDRGETLEGTIKKLNRKKAKILLTKGNTRFATGKILVVPYELLGLADFGRKITNDIASGSNTIAPPVAFKPFGWWVLDHHHELQILAGIFNGLSPENLACDGEASMTWIRNRRVELERKLKAVYVLLGREITEDALYQIQKDFPKEYDGTHSMSKIAGNLTLPV